MAEDNFLQDTINKARDEFHEKEPAKSGSSRPGKKAVNLQLLILAAILLGLFKYVVIDEGARQVREDLAVSALDLFMEADASVILFHQANRRLPDVLPAAALAPFVTYRELDDSRYSLRVNLPGHDAEIERNIANISPPANIESLLGL